MGWVEWLLVVVLLSAAIGLTWHIARIKTTRGQRRALTAAAHGRAMEALAPQMLARRGYTILDEQVDRRYEFLVDDAPHEAVLRADLLAARHGKRYVVEIKTGKSGKATHRGTRRQLLEYALYYDVDAVLLLDADRDALFEVVFPAEPTRSSHLKFAAGLCLGAALIGTLWIIVG